MIIYNVDFGIVVPGDSLPTPMNASAGAKSTSEYMFFQAIHTPSPSLAPSGSETSITVILSLRPDNVRTVNPLLGTAQPATSISRSPSSA
ncbi:hypothetical protein BDR06DRAFT_964760 [Suillus hirtellus]|nr:hypothetical protein BDR06DRAFT_964760 [Suillus hirtellus]